MLAETDVKQGAFALATGIELTRLQNICAGKIKGLRVEEARQIRLHYGYRELWLLEGKGPKRIPESEAKSLTLRDVLSDVTADVLSLELSDQHTSFLHELLFYWRSKDKARLEELLATKPASMDYVYVARYDVQASAGPGAVVHDESVVDHLAFKRDWITRTLGLDPQRLALIDVAGDSMTPTIGDGDLILIDTRPTTVRSEGVYVINLNGALLVKRLRMRLTGVVDVVSDNERYGTETISGEQLTQLAILGRVVWQGRRV